MTDAVLNGHRIRIRYSSWERQSTKTLEPYGLVLKGGRWYLVAGSTRKNRTPSTYRIDQIVDITSLDQPFEPPSGFDLAAYWNDSVRSFKERLRSGTAVIKLSANGAEHYRQATGEHPAVIDRSSDGWATAIAPINPSATHEACFFSSAPRSRCSSPRNYELRWPLPCTSWQLSTNSLRSQPGIVRCLRAHPQPVLRGLFHAIEREEELVGEQREPVAAIGDDERLRTVGITRRQRQRTERQHSIVSAPLGRDRLDEARLG